MRGPKPLVVNIIVNYCCTCVLLWPKMLKETETEETKPFLSHFYHLWHFDWGGKLSGPLSGYAYGHSKVRKSVPKPHGGHSKTSNFDAMAVLVIYHVCHIHWCKVTKYFYLSRLLK